MTVRDWASHVALDARRDGVARALWVAAVEAWIGLAVRWREWRAARGDGTTTVTLAGVHCRFAVADRTDVRRARDVNGERPALEWLLAAVGPRSVVWDVGARHGHYGIAAAHRGATTVCFEPHDPSRAVLETNVTLNCVGDAIDVRPVGLSDGAGTVTAGGDGTVVIGDGDGRVPVVRGDDCEPAPDVVKIDVEGHELAALAGLAESLTDCRRVLVEVHDESEVPAVVGALEGAGLATTPIETRRRQTFIAAARDPAVLP